MGSSQSQSTAPPPALAGGPCQAGAFANMGTAQAGQDMWMLREGLLKCKAGTFVEFGARDGIEHSNTYFFEKSLGWKGLLFEADPTQYAMLKENRPASTTFEGAVCPRGQRNLTFGVSRLGGWSGDPKGYEPTRKHEFQHMVNVKCYNLAYELMKRNIHQVDYMTIDTEGSEVAIVEDFPWRDFRVKIVQIEQLDERGFPAQRGKKGRVIRRMESVGYRLLKAYTVAQYDTEDLIFELDERPSRSVSLDSLNKGASAAGSLKKQPPLVGSRRG